MFKNLSVCLTLCLPSVYCMEDGIPCLIGGASASSTSVDTVTIAETDPVAFARDILKASGRLLTKEEISNATLKLANLPEVRGMSLLIRVREAYQKGINFGAALPDADIGADDTPIDKTITAAKVQGVTDGTHFIVFPHHGLTVRTLNGLKNGTHHVVADQVLAAAKSETAIQQARLRALSTTFNKLFADAKADMLANPARRPATMAALGLDDIGAQATIQALISKIGHNIQPIKGDGTHAGPAVDAATFLSGIKDATIADMNEDATWAALRAAHRDAGVEIARVEKLAELFVAML